MRQKLWSLADGFVVRDGSGNTAYTIDGKLFAIRQTLVMHDELGKEVLTIRKRIVSVGTTYDVLRDGRSIATVHQHLFTLVRAKFTVDVTGPDDLEATGNFTSHEYAFTRGRAEVAHVSKRWFSVTDSYGIEISEGEDHPLIIAAAVVIDMCVSPDEKPGTPTT